MGRRSNTVNAARLKNKMETQFSKPISATEAYVEKNKDNIRNLRSWALWYPDLFLDLLRPSSGGLRLHMDQRVSMRCDSRFFGYYGCFPRGSSKSLNQILVCIVLCIVYPGIEIAVSAQTKENAIALLTDKVNEALKWYPAIQDEVRVWKSNKLEAQLIFKNNARMTVLANSQSSKGMRRTRLRIEEAALLKSDVYEDALRPIVAVPRLTIGEYAVVNPEELSGQINFYTTTGFRGSDEFNRVTQMYDDMLELKGDIVLGADWMLPCWYGRTASKAEMLKIKASSSPMAFAMNYMEEWVGVATGALVSINNLLKCRNMLHPCFSAQPEDEIVIGVDVARSEADANNRSAIVVTRIKRNQYGRPSSIDLINILGVSNALSFEDQALMVKRIKEQYSNAEKLNVVVDANGVGAGLVDALLQPTYDSEKDIEYPSWNTMNTDSEPYNPAEAEEILYALKAQGIQSKILSDFVGAVDSGVLRLLEQKQYDLIAAEQDDEYRGRFRPFIETNLLVDEIANLKVEPGVRGIGIRQAVSRVNKDRFSALSYAIYYAMDKAEGLSDMSEEFDKLFAFRAPKLRL